MCSDRTLKILTHSVWRGSKYKGYIQRHALRACVHRETQRVFKIYPGLATTHHHAWQHSNFGKKSLITSAHQLRPSGLQLYKLHRRHGYNINHRYTSPWLSQPLCTSASSSQFDHHHPSILYLIQPWFLPSIIWHYFTVHFPSHPCRSKFWQSAVAACQVNSNYTNTLWLYKQIHFDYINKYFNIRFINRHQNGLQMTCVCFETLRGYGWIKTQVEHHFTPL